MVITCKGRIHKVMGFRHVLYLSVLRSRNYLFSAPTLAPAPPFSIILAPAPAPAPALYWHLKLFYNSSTTRNMFQWRFVFILASSKLTIGNIYLIRSFRLWVQVSHNFGSGSATLVFIVQTFQSPHFLGAFLTLFPPPPIQLLKVLETKCFTIKKSFWSE